MEGEVEMQALPVPADAVERLIEGNLRFAHGRSTRGAGVDPDRREEVAGGQRPWAVVLACADSRVAPEHLFDAGLGELFVCRTAGNLVDTIVTGSIEYAVAQCGCPLVCVVGHSSCGAAAAAVAADHDPAQVESESLAFLVNRFGAVLAATRGEVRDDVAWADAAARENVARTCHSLVGRSTILADAVAVGRCGVVGLWYDLASGLVEVVVPLGAAQGLDGGVVPSVP